VPQWADFAPLHNGRLSKIRSGNRDEFSGRIKPAFAFLISALAGICETVSASAVQQLSLANRFTHCTRGPERDAVHVVCDEIGYFSDEWQERGLL